MRSRVARGVVLTLLVLTGITGLLNGVRGFGQPKTPAQALVTVSVLVYGLCGLGAATIIATRRPRARWLVAVWGVALSTAATVAPRAYGGPDVPWAGAIAGGVATAVIAVLTWWATPSSIVPAGTS